MADLDPDAAALLERLRAAGGPPLHELTPEQVRAAHVASAAALAGPGEDVAEVRDAEVDGVRVRTYRPEGAQGAVVYAHGGGWVVGTLDTYDTTCRALANRCGATVVSVDYDLAPEARHPVQVEQVGAVLRGVLRQGGAVALAGDSAGAHLVALAAGVALRDGARIAALALVYPVVSPGLQTPSAVEHATGRYLETASMRWYWEQYVPAARTDVPHDLAEQDLTGFPPTLVLTAGFDPLRDEGRRLVDALERGGVPVERLDYEGQIHGFFRMRAVIGQAHDAMDRVAGFLRTQLG